MYLYSLREVLVSGDFWSMILTFLKMKAWSRIWSVMSGVFSAIFMSGVRMMSIIWLGLRFFA